MKKISLLGAFFSFLIISNMSFAQTARNINQRTNNRTEVARGDYQLNQDIRELTAFRSTLDRIEIAWRNHDRARLNQLKHELVSDMLREIDQSRYKLNQAKREAQQSKAELHSDHRNARGNRHYNTSASRRDNIRDTNDDLLDLEDRYLLLDQQEHIYNTLRAFNFNLNGPSFERARNNKALFYDFERTMEKDLAATRAELAEDRRELQENRREDFRRHR